MPQIVYYISSYADLLKTGQIKDGEQINVAVPTGNFGNILAAYIAMLMGTPIDKLICASNKNNILTDFINTGVYDKNRDFYATASPSMDILISSNLERLLYLLCGKDNNQIKGWFGGLSKEGRYEVGADVFALLKERFCAGCCDDLETFDTIKKIYQDHGYVLDTHTAVAVKVYQDYKAKTGDNKKTLIARTANPYKFSESVLAAITGEPNSELGEFDTIDKLFKLTNMPIPKSLSELKDKEIRFKKVIPKAGLLEYVLGELGGV